MLSNQGQKVTSEQLGNKRLFLATKQRGPEVGVEGGEELGRKEGKGAPSVGGSALTQGSRREPSGSKRGLFLRQERKPPLKGPVTLGCAIQTF